MLKISEATAHKITVPHPISLCKFPVKAPNKTSTPQHYVSQAQKVQAGHIRLPNHMSKGLRREKLLPRIRNIDPYDFQEFVTDLWELQGHNTEIIRDQGVHILAEKDEGVMGQGFAIQTRRLSEGYKVDSSDIAEFIDARMHDDVDSVIVITTTDFTENAIERANREGMRLVNGDDLENLINDLDAIDLIDKYEKEKKDTKPAPSLSELPAQETLGQVGAATGVWVLTLLMATVFPMTYPEHASTLFLVGFGGGLFAWFAIPVTLNRDTRNLKAQNAEYRPNPTLWAILGLAGAGIVSSYYLYRRFTRGN